MGLVMSIVGVCVGQVSRVGKTFSQVSRVGNLTNKGFRCIQGTKGQKRVESARSAPGLRAVGRPPRRRHPSQNRTRALGFDCASATLTRPAGQSEDPSGVYAPAERPVRSGQLRRRASRSTPGRVVPGDFRSD